MTGVINIYSSPRCSSTGRLGSLYNRNMSYTAELYRLNYGYRGKPSTLCLGVLHLKCGKWKYFSHDLYCHKAFNTTPLNYIIMDQWLSLLDSWAFQFLYCSFCSSLRFFLDSIALALILSKYSEKSISVSYPSLVFSSSLDYVILNTRK